jgi:hypothetical protein
MTSFTPPTSYPTFRHESFNRHQLHDHDTDDQTIVQHPPEKTAQSNGSDDAKKAIETVH